MARQSKNTVPKNRAGPKNNAKQANRSGPAKANRAVINLASDAEQEAHPVRFETPSNTGRQRSVSWTPNKKPKPGDTVIDIAATSDDEAYRVPEASQKRKARASMGPEGPGSAAKRQATENRSRAVTVPPPLNRKPLASEESDVSDDAMDVDNGNDATSRGRGRRK